MARSKADMPKSGRQRLAKQGKAIPDKESGGRFPISNRGDLLRAIKAVGRAKPDDRAKIRAYIKRRAKALGLSNLIPDSWS